MIEIIPQSLSEPIQCLLVVASVMTAAASVQALFYCFLPKRREREKRRREGGEGERGGERGGGGEKNYMYSKLITLRILSHIPVLIFFDFFPPYNPLISPVD